MWHFTDFFLPQPPIFRHQSASFCCIIQGTLQEPHDWCMHTQSLQSCLTLLWPHGLCPARLLCPRDFSGKNTGVGCHFLLQGIFPTHGSNLHRLCLLRCTQILYPLSHWKSPVTFFIGWGQLLLVTFHLKALIIACCVMVFSQIFCEMTFNVC